MNQNNQETAFPVAWTEGPPMHHGMTLRDYFAAKAMQGICVNVGRNQFSFDRPEEIAEKARELADAMLKGRNK